MKTYTIKEGETFSSLGKKLGLEDGYALRTFHNLYCKKEDLIHSEPVAGQQLTIPNNPETLNSVSEFENNEGSEVYDKVEGPDNGLDDDADSESTEESSSSSENEDKSEKEEDQKEDSGKNEHDGKYFVIQKGKAQCNQGMKFPNFKVTSHQKHYWNDEKGEADYLAVTEDDLQFNPPAQPFGPQCKLQPSGNSYLPCSYAPARKWTKCYEKVKVMEKSCLTEISELQCAIGGKITVMKHGQQSEMGKSNVKKADEKEQRVYNPIVDYGEFQEEVNPDSFEVE